MSATIDVTNGPTSVSDLLRLAIADHETMVTAYDGALDAIRKQTRSASRGSIEVRECSRCHEEYPEWASVATPSTCPSCAIMGLQPSAEPSVDVSGSLRHDTPADVAAAALSYEAARGLARLTGATPSDLPSWDRAPSWIASQFIELARGVVAGTISTAEEAHSAWRAARDAEGWLFGPVADPIKKRHPNLLDWAALSPAEQRKQRLIMAIMLTVTR